MIDTKKQLSFFSFSFLDGIHFHCISKNVCRLVYFKWLLAVWHLFTSKNPKPRGKKSQLKTICTRCLGHIGIHNWDILNWCVIALTHIFSSDKRQRERKKYVEKKREKLHKKKRSSFSEKTQTSSEIWNELNESKERAENKRKFLKFLWILIEKK